MHQNAVFYSHSSEKPLTKGLPQLSDCCPPLLSHEQAGLVPEVPLLPGDGVEDGGDDEEAGQAKAIDPGRDGLPLVVGEDVEDGAAEDAGQDPELEGRSKLVAHNLHFHRAATVRSLLFLSGVFFFFFFFASGQSKSQNL